MAFRKRFGGKRRFAKKRRRVTRSYAKKRVRPLRIGYRM